MSARHFGPALRHWLNSLAGQTTADLADEQLLNRFLKQRDESAFETLMRRHGPLVLGVCRRLLRDSDDADDAFQATFLVLACRAASIRRRHSLAGFLYGTACRIAARLRNQKTQQHRLQKRVASEHTEATSNAAEDLETAAILHEELNRLPCKYRELLILCYLQGKSNEEAAGELGYPLGSMSRHLSRARELLRERLLNRGVDGLAILAGAAIAEQAGAAVSPALLCGALATIRRHALASALLAGSTPPAAVMLAQGILRAVWVTRLTAASLLLTVGLVFAGGVAVLQTPADKPSPAEAKAPVAPIQKKGQQPPRLDVYGDPLPDGVLVRMGTARLRHPQAIRLHFAADGKTLISLGQDQTVRFWDLATGKMQRLQQLPQTQKAMALSADGKTVALTSEENLHLWDIAAGKEICRIATGKLDEVKRINWVDFSPDGKTLAGFNRDSTVFLWDLVGGRELARYKHKDRYLSNLAFSPNGKMLAAAGDQHILLWDRTSGKELTTIKGVNYVARLAFSPDSKLLAMSSYNAVRLWDAATGNKRADLPFDESDKKRHLSSYHLAFAPDGKTIAAGLGDYLVLWDRATSKEVKRLLVSKSGAWHGSDWMAFSADGKRLASLTSGKITLWDLVGDKQLQERPSHLYGADSAAVSPDGKYVASACGRDQTVRLWDARSGKLLHVWLMPHRRIYPVLFTPDSNSVLAAGYHGECRMWDAASGKERHSFRAPGVLRDVTPQDFAEMITGMHLSPDGKHLTALSLRSETKDKVNVRRRYLTTWDVASGERTQRRTLSFDERISIDLEELSPDGRYAPIFTGGRVMIYDVVADRPLRYLTGTWSDSKAFSADGKLLAYSENVTEKSARVRLHDLATGADVWTLDVGRVFLRAFSPDCRYLLTIGDAGLYLWELSSGKEVLRYPSLTHLPLWFCDRCVEFAPDGRSVVVGVPDSNILIWDLAPATRQTRKLTAADLDRLWTELADKDAARAYQAAGTFIADPERSVPFLSDRLKPIKEDARRIHRLAADLDSEQFPVRDAAWKELEKMDDAAHAELRQELAKAKSLEQRRRIQALLTVAWLVQTPEKLRQIRAVMVLEQIGDAASRRVLERLAGGAAEARQTREAKTALQRLQNRR